MAARCVAALLLLLHLAAAAMAQEYVAQSILVDCGATGNTTAPSTGQVWIGDEGGSFVNGGTAGNASANSSFLLSNTGQDQALYQTARFFNDKGTYTFSVTPGRHWLRLHFVAFSSGQFDPTKSLFSVSADRYDLVSNFSVLAVTSGTVNKPLLVKEYSINVTSTSLTVTFQPEPGSYAFVNAIEVVSLPGDVYRDDALFNDRLLSFKMSSVGLQTMYRLNVGGGSVSPANDSDLSRTWVQDTPFIWGSAKGFVPQPANPQDIIYPADLPEYIAPRSVYSTARIIGLSDSSSRINITWTFAVDVGYWYYVRLHFCDFLDTQINVRVFNVYLNNETATANLDLVLAKGASTAYYMDYAVNMIDGTDSTLWVQLGPSPASASSSLYFDIILNGLEILKLNDTSGSLVGGNAVLKAADPGVSSPSGKKSNTYTMVGAAVGAAAVLVVMVALGLVCFKVKKAKKEKHVSPAWLPLASHGGNSATSASKMSALSLKSGTGSYVSSVPSNHGRYFSFAELVEATNNFDEGLLLGVGGFGKVYKGELDDGTKVAVKRGNPRSEQGLTEFQTEIEMLSKLRHRHLVSLIGYCEEHSEMILVYDYMANGPLRGHLYGSDLPALSWRQRLEICIGSARGLHYLHTGAEQGIIHRDVKTTNILLDENLVAKVADFGLSKTGPTLDRTHVSTAVKGSFGYLDPEYFRRQQLTEKSDVYSFGVVLVEVLCARPAINPALPREQVNMAEWAMHWLRLGLLEQIIDPKLKGYCNPESLKKFGETAEKCLQEQGIDRPAMGDVLWNLEYALQLQETSLESNLMEDSVNRSMEVPLRPVSLDSSQGTQATDSQSLGSRGDSEDVTASAVFSQLVNPQGR